MSSRLLRWLVPALAVAVLSVPALSAQSVEINPYFGGLWPDSSATGELKTNALWGVRAGFYTDQSFSLEANLGYLNHFEVKGIDPDSGGFLWEVAPTYHFAPRDWALPGSFRPFLNVGLGGITTMMDPDSFTFNRFETVQFVGAPAGTTATLIRPVEMESGDTFFTVSPGGGVTIGGGSVAFRGDLRVRVLPNYYKSSPIALEAAVGVSFFFGGRQ